ncbi:MAG: molybdopterin-dependent oxidoreductase [Gammaproteobacteria bacterium]|nr:molybdopterin-dependent oxidoreductase [Gammaproteobacteria bacterium]
MARRKAELGVVGRSQPRLDGAEKLTGRAVFTDDVVLPGLLHGRIVRSPLPRARILNIDVSAALRLPGVKAVITHADAPKVYVGIEQPLFRKDVVNYVGDEVAAVAAMDEATAAEAARLIRVDYEPLPAVLTLKDAMQPGAVQIHAKAKGNVAWAQSRDHGDVDAAFAASAHVRTDAYTTPASHNCYAEFHSVVADWSRPDKLSVWTPTQTALLFQKAIARALGLTDGAVRIMSLHTGGGFTGRSAARPHHFIAPLLSRKAGRPVKIRVGGDEEFIVCRAGGEVQYRFRTGVSADGLIKAFEADLSFDTGAYVESQMIVLILTAAYIHSLYKLEATRYSGRLIHTNNIPYYFHHGGGIAQMAFGLGLHMDALAREIGMDPVDFHLRNAVTKGHTNMTGTFFGSCGLKECITRAAKKAGWKRKYGKLPPLKGIGLGIGAMASGAKGVFRHDTSAAFIKIQDDGTMSLFIGLPDMGQSSHTAMAIIAAEVLGVQPPDITVIAGDTDVTPLDVGAFTQRGTFNTGNAVKAACLDARQQIAVTAAGILGVKPARLEFRGGMIYPRGEPGRSVPFRKAVYDTLHSREGRFVMGRGFYNSPKETGTMAFSFGAQIAEVTVNPDTGMVTVDRVIAAHDVGRAINPRIVEGQIDGQIFSGMSQVLYEEMLLEDGQVMNPSRLDYRLPRSYEMPAVEHIIVETIDPFGPFGAKEVGEGPIVCTLPAIANAVANALGAPVNAMPITPWEILRILGRRRPPGD